MQKDIMQGLVSMIYVLLDTMNDEEILKDLLKGGIDVTVQHGNHVITYRNVNPSKEDLETALAEVKEALKKVQDFLKEGFPWREENDS